MEREARIFVAGAGTFIGAALTARLRALGFSPLGGGDRGPDLRDASAVDAFFASEAPEYVFLAAGRSGGIAANQRQPADLMLDNLLVQDHVLSSAHRHGVRKLLFLASACIYPRECEQPMHPSQLMTGPVEPTSEAYAVAKLAGLTLCRALRRQHGARFVTAIPANVFGPGDDFDSEDAHVIGALVRRMHQAKLRDDDEVVVWGSGRPRRDFLYVEDLADACVLLMERYEGEEPVNVSSGQDVSIRELAECLQKVVGFHGRLRFDASRPDGAPRKVLDGGVLAALGFRPGWSLDQALAATYGWFAAREGTGRV